MEQKDTYTLRELFDNLPIALAELARESRINEVTLARLRDGKPGRRSTINKMLLELSKVYDRQLTMKNVTGINVQVSKRTSKSQASA